MKWITRERARVDRIACPWLITRFVDPAPEFLFVPAGDVMAVAAREHATPFDVPAVELGHHGSRCSFDAFLDRYDLDDPGLVALAEIVRGADTDHRDLTPESAGLYAAARAFRRSAGTTTTTWRASFRCTTRLYDFCRARAGARRRRGAVSSVSTGPRRGGGRGALRALAARRAYSLPRRSGGTVPRSGADASGGSSDWQPMA